MIIIIIIKRYVWYPTTCRAQTRFDFLPTSSRIDSTHVYPCPNNAVISVQGFYINFQAYDFPVG